MAKRSATDRCIPLLPVLSGLRDFFPGGAKEPCVLDAGDAIWLESGAMAIFAALRELGVHSEHSVMLPAFHCPAMLNPVLRVGAEPIFYAVTTELEITLSTLTARIRSNTKAIIVPHLFGKLQDLAQIRALCDELGVALIEDCAHSFFGIVNEKVVGSVGDYAIASPRKFFPLSLGGILIRPKRSQQLIAAKKAGFVAGGRALFDGLDLAVQAGRLRGVAPLILVAKKLAALKKNVVTENHDSGAQNCEVAAVNDWQENVINADAVTKALCGLCSHSYIMKTRQANYERISKVVEGTNKYALLDLLDGQAVPYMVPVLLRNADVQFGQLKAAGLPVWRWEYSARGHCSVTDRYATDLIQIPCHQALLPDELQRIDEILSG